MTLKPLVSVCMITYNHEKYIIEAIEGVLMQVCDFDIELIIADDCSPDKTMALVKQIQNNHSQGHWIKYTRHQANNGMIPNFVWALQQCKGKYIALCEGDDYWTDPLKLQKQVDFLEANPDYAICFHQVDVFNQETQKFEIDTITRKVDETTSVIELAKGNFIHTTTVVLRNDFEIPKWFKKALLGDWSLYIFAVRNRKIKKIQEVMAVYRVHENGIWVTKTQEHRNELTRKTVSLVYTNLKKELPKNVLLILKSRLAVSKPKYKMLFDKIHRKFLK